MMLAGWAEPKQMYTENPVALGLVPISYVLPYQRLAGLNRIFFWQKATRLHVPQVRIMTISL